MGVPALQQQGLDASLVEKLLGAWQSLQRSVLLADRGIDIAVRDNIVDMGEGSHAQAARTAMTTPGLRICALPSCGAREAHQGHFQRLSRGFLLLSRAQPRGLARPQTSVSGRLPSRGCSRGKQACYLDAVPTSFPVQLAI